MLLTVSGIPADMEVQEHLTSLRIDEWLQEDVFHFRWWVLIVLLTVAIFVWWKMVDKKRLPEIMLYAALTTFLTMGLDEIGEELTLWDYPTDIVPIFPPLAGINLATLSMIFSLIYQYFGTWKRFLVATVITAAVFSLILEPILAWVKLYQLLTWKYYYSFLMYTAMAISVRLVTIKIIAFTEKSKKKV